MEIPLDGSDKFSRELVEGFILDKVGKKAENFNRRMLNSKNPVTKNPKTPRGMVNDRVQLYFDKQYYE